MTLRELILSVNAEEYADYPLYQELLKVKPEYGSSRHIEVRIRDGKVVVYNVHIGSLGDIVTYQIDVDPDLQITKIQLLDAILAEMSSEQYGEEEQSEFWNDMTNLQKAKIIR
jgi:hypothetical protein